MSALDDLSTSLAEMASKLAVETLPEPARHNARRTLANSLALSAGAATHPAVQVVARGLRCFGGTGVATVLGTSELRPGAHAALVNGMAAHVEDFDDTHLETVVHPGAPVVPAALAAAELTLASGATLLAGVAAGVEVASRVGLALGPAHFDRGWHLTGTAGHVGAAAAAARVLGLDPLATRDALAFAAVQAAGLQEALGTMVKALHAGKAAADGFLAAMMAAEGLHGPPAPLEGRRGLLALASPEADLERAQRDLGRTWELARNAFKPYACGIVSHPIIDAAVALGEQLGRDASSVRTVTVRVNPVVLDVMGVTEPTTGLQSKFSAYHCFAVGFIDGVAGPAQYTDGVVARPDVRDLRGKVAVVLDPAIRRDECFATVEGPSGPFSWHVEHASGSVDQPVTDEQLEAKAVAVSGPVLGDEAARGLFAAAMDIDRKADLTALLAAAVPAERAASTPVAFDERGIS